jgi:hypothetical protein
MRITRKHSLTQCAARGIDVCLLSVIVTILILQYNVSFVKDYFVNLINGGTNQSQEIHFRNGYGV